MIKLQRATSWGSRRKTHHKKMKTKHKKKPSAMRILFSGAICWNWTRREWGVEKGSRRRKPIPVPAGEMIDMGAFPVMYKNVPLIAAHSCGRACRKTQRPPQVPQFPRCRPMCLPPNTHHQAANPQCSVWCTSFPSCASPLRSRLGARARMHTHALICAEIQSDA